MSGATKAVNSAGGMLGSVTGVLRTYWKWIFGVWAVSDPAPAINAISGLLWWAHQSLWLPIIGRIFG